jgi:hypothetical protein
MILKSVAAAVVLALASRAEAGLCEKYMAIVIKGAEDVAPTQDVTRWAEYALKAEGRYAAKGPCVLVLQPIAVKVTNKGGNQMGWAVAFHISTRRIEDTGPVQIDEENIYIFTGSELPYLRQALRDDIEKFISTLGK